MIPQGFIQDLLARVDIVDVVGRHVQLKKGGQNYLGLCPFHAEKSPSFTVSPSKQFFHCFGCGAHGSAIGFLMDHRGLSYVEAIHELAHQVGLQVPESDQIAGERSRARGLTDLLDRAATFYRTQLRQSSRAIGYLKERGLTGQTAARYALGYAPDDWQGLRGAFDNYDDPQLVEAGLVIVGEAGRRYDRFRDRVVFPIRNRRGAVIGFGGRVMGAGEPKYLNSPETAVFRKGHELYGLFEAQEAVRIRKRVIVCEGYLDVIRLAQFGFEEAVAALGTAVTSQHVATLFRLTDQVVFAFDGDAAGRKAARRALEAALPVIGDEKRVGFALLPEGEDPDSLVGAQGAEGFERQLRAALPLSRWFLRALSDERDLSQAEDRAALLAEARPLLESMPAGALRLQLMRELAEAARTPAEDIEALFGLRKWRRLATEPGRAERRTLAPVADLKARILRLLIAFPELAREFNAQIAAESLESAEPVDRRIAEVWRAATSGACSSTAALVESLAESDDAALYRQIAVSDLALLDDPAVARADLQSGFGALALRRIEAELETLVQRDLTAEVRERIQLLSEQRARLKAQLRSALPDRV